MGPIHVLEAAIKIVPSVKLALATVIFSLVATGVVLLTSDFRGSVILAVVTLIGMFLILVIAQLATASSAAVNFLWQGFTWSIVTFMIVSMALTLTALLFRWPLSWDIVLLQPESEPELLIQAAKMLLGVGSVLLGFSSLVFIVINKWRQTTRETINIQLGETSIAVAVDSLSKEDLDKIIKTFGGADKKKL